MARRLTAGVALVALPLGAAVGCGSAATAQKDSVQTSLQKASDNLKASGSTSFELRLEDPTGSLKKAATSGADATKPEQADLLLGGRVSFTVDPTGGKTLADLQTMDPALPITEQLKASNIAMTVQADGGAVVQVRLVGGDVYANVDVDKASDLATKAGSPSDLGQQLDEAAAQAPAQLAPILTDVRAGKWLKLPLAPYAEQLKALQPTPGASASIDSRRLGMDLLNAVKPYVAVTDASSDGDTRVLDVKVQAKQALKAAVTSLKAMGGAVPGLAQLDTSSLDAIGDGTANGQVTLESDHLTKITLDLGSAVALAPVGATPAPDLSGALVTIEVDDSADDVTVPDDVSWVDLGALVDNALASLGGGVRS
jgi:hypothetical protein